jgi:hypothetical protein
MTDIMALDIETSNYSYEIGGWSNKALFDTSVVATWDGEEAHIFSKEDLEIDGVTIHPLHPRALGDHLQNHIEKGGQILGHNLFGFDLPVLRDSLDCWAAGDIMQKKDAVIDTKNLVSSASLSKGKVETSLQSLVSQTLGKSKSMKSVDAPLAWREGKFTEVAEYCLKDAKLTYDLFLHGRDTGIVKSRSLESGDIMEIEVEW